MYFRTKRIPKLHLMRTCSLAKKQCAPPKAVLHSEPRIHWRKRAKQRGRCFATPTPYFFQNHLVRLRCVYFTKLEPIFKIVITSVPRALKRHHAKRGASAEAEVRGNALHSATMFWGQRRRSAEMRNASEILRNAGGLGESISQNSLRVLPDFLAGFWRAGYG